MHLSARAKRLVILLAFFAASTFATMLYYLFFSAIIEVTALPRALEISKELAAANRPDLYLEVCRAFVESVEDGERKYLSVMALLRVGSLFMITSSGILLLIGIRLFRLGGVEGDAESRPGRFSPARFLDYLISLWEGKRSLRSAFWAFSLPLTVAVWTATLFLINQLKGTKELETLLYMSLVCGVAAVCYLFTLGVVWRCACNTSKKTWGWLARIIVTLLVVEMTLRLYGAAQTIRPLLRGLGIL